MNIEILKVIIGILSLNLEILEVITEKLSLSLELLEVITEILSVNPEILEVIIEASSVALLLSRALCQHGEQVSPIFVSNLIVASLIVLRMSFFVDYFTNQTMKKSTLTTRTLRP